MKKSELEVENASLKKALKLANTELGKMISDNSDMLYSHKTSFERCKCGHIHDKGLICSHCKE